MEDGRRVPGDDVPPSVLSRRPSRAFRVTLRWRHRPGEPKPPNARRKRQMSSVGKSVVGAPSPSPGPARRSSGMASYGVRVGPPGGTIGGLRGAPTGIIATGRFGAEGRGGDKG